MKVIRRLPINYDVRDESLFKHELEKEIPLGEALIQKNGIVLNDSITNRILLKPFFEYSHRKPIPYKHFIKQLPLIIRKWIKVGKAIWIVDEWSGGYFHWLTDSLSRLILGSMVSDVNVVLLPEHLKPVKFIGQSLKYIGYHPLYYSTSTPLIINELVLTSHTAPSGNYNIDIINKLRQKFVPKNAAKGIRRIYISRSKAPKRKVLNEEELYPILSKYNIEVHHFEQYSFDKQVELMKEAEILIGLHGAGLTNMLFMHARSKVLELRMDGDDKNNCYFAMASALNIDYYYQLNPLDGLDTHVGNVKVNEQLFDENIKKLIEA